MVVREDPELNEVRSLSHFTDLKGAQVLEIGCGDGRLTWRYAGETAHVIAIDPFEASIVKARQDFPDHLRHQVDFHHISFEDYSPQSESAAFDVIILSWSLC